MIRRTLVLAAAVAVAGTLTGAALASHSWGSYHWGRTANPVPLTVIDATSSNWTSYVNTAVSDWDASTMLSLTKTTGSARKRCPAVSGKIQVCNSTYGNNGWLGLATIWTVSGTTHIAQATTKLNDTYLNSGTYNTPAYHQFVVCQEVGHDFGLDHQDENFNNANLGSCMDYDQLLCIYDPANNGRTLSTTTHSCTGTGHLDSSNTWTGVAYWLAQHHTTHYDVREGRFVKHVYIIWLH